MESLKTLIYISEIEGFGDNYERRMFNLQRTA